jgi:transcription elongation GreA/GreB family factor
MGLGLLVTDHEHVQTKLTTHADRAAVRRDRAGARSIVTVQDPQGRLAEYELLAEEDQLLPRHRVRLSSAVGFALAGARVGDVVWLAEDGCRPRQCFVRELTAPPGSRRS